MLENFFQLSPIPADIMVGTYDPTLVILSYIVATFASYVALDITGRLRDLHNTQLALTLWLIGGAVAMGAGIWSMHFIGMLAFKMPMDMGYDPSLTLLSMMVAIGASAFALYLLKATVINNLRLILGGIVLGFAIAAMHYTGMEAMRVSMNIHYLPSLFILSIVIAIIASEAALYLAIKSTQVIPKLRFRLKFVSAFIMGAAICGMHYTGVEAAIFTHKHDAIANTPLIDPELIAISIAGVTLFILGIAFVVSTYKESLNQQLLITARQAGMAEVAASVLHNVGNVLNSVNVSSTLIHEKIQKSRLSDLSELKKLLNEHKGNFEKFIFEDPRGKYLPKYLSNLADYWDNEKMTLENEVQVLVKNIEHIKKIIATQQNISRVAELEQIASISDLLEESILICGVEDKKHAIKVHKKYAQLSPIVVDKAKLLQILINLTQNAKESVCSSGKSEKEIIFVLEVKNSSCFIQITDNGVGISRDKLIRIFEYGFTTKNNGHGFGLHTSAVTAKEMGGDLTAQSNGPNTGATFILTLPYKLE